MVPNRPDMSSGDFDGRPDEDRKELQFVLLLILQSTWPKHMAQNALLGFESEIGPLTSKFRKNWIIANPKNTFASE